MRYKYYITMAFLATSAKFCDYSSRQHLLNALALHVFFTLQVGIRHIWKIQLCPLFKGIWDC